MNAIMSLCYSFRQMCLFFCGNPSAPPHSMRNTHSDLRDAGTGGEICLQHRISDLVPAFCPHETFEKLSFFYFPLEMHYFTFYVFLFHLWRRPKLRVAKSHNRGNSGGKFQILCLVIIINNLKGILVFSLFLFLFLSLTRTSWVCYEMMFNHCIEVWISVNIWNLWALLFRWIWMYDEKVLFRT